MEENHKRSEIEIRRETENKTNAKKERDREHVARNGVVGRIQFVNLCFVRKLFLSSSLNNGNLSVELLTASFFQNFFSVGSDFIKVTEALNFWFVTPRGLACGYQCFRGTYFLHLHL